MNSKRPILGGCVPEILICLFGFVACLIPALVYTDPFWGVDSLADKALTDFGNSPGVILLEIAPNSPAASAGLQKNDRIISVNDKPADFTTFRNLLHDFQAGQPVTFDGLRGQQSLHLGTTAEEPKLEAVMFFDWQFMSAPIFLVFALILISTQPLEPAPLWRAILTIPLGLSIASIIVAVEATHRFRVYTPVWQSKAIDKEPSAVFHYSLLVAMLLMALVLSFLGSLATRRVFMHRVIASTVPNN